MTSPSALTEKAKTPMDSKMTVEQIEDVRKSGELWNDKVIIPASVIVAICDLALLAISPPSDVAALIEDLKGAEWVCDDERLPFSKETCRKAADALLSQAARIAKLEAGLNVETLISGLMKIAPKETLALRDAIHGAFENEQSGLDNFLTALRAAALLGEKP